MMTLVCWILTISNTYTLTIVICDGHKVKKGFFICCYGLVPCGDLLVCIATQCNCISCVCNHYRTKNLYAILPVPIICVQFKTMSITLIGTLVPMFWTINFLWNWTKNGLFKSDWSKTSQTRTVVWPYPIFIPNLKSSVFPSFVKITITIFIE